MILRKNRLLDFLYLFTFSFTLRLYLIKQSPYLYEYDGYMYMLGIVSEYPLFTGFIKTLIDLNFSVLSIRIITALTGSLACFAFYLLARRLFNRRIALVSAFLMSLYPSFLTFSIVPYTEPLFFLLFFTGLYFYENEKKGDFLFKTGLFIGLACLTRYESFIMLALISSIVTIRAIKNVPEPLKNIIKNLLILWWIPLGLVAYKYIFFPSITTEQYVRTPALLAAIPSMISDVFHSEFSRISEELIVCGLKIPLITFFISLLLALLGIMTACIRDRKTHFVYLVFIASALFIQLIPIVANYLAYSGKIIGLRRHGMIPFVFLLIYLTYFANLFISKLSEKMKKKKVLQAVFLIFMTLFIGTSSFMTSNFIIKDYQKLYRKCVIIPHWIGQIEDRGKAIITSLSDKGLLLRLSGKPFRKFNASIFEHMSSKDIENFINRENVKYIFHERNSSRPLKVFLKRNPPKSLRQLATIGNWLSVYIYEDQ